MRLEKIILQNYRGYRNKIEIKVDSITAFIGKNDAGKSTILEALNTFFNMSKLDLQDRCVYCDDEEDTIIGCSFSGYPNDIIIDETVRTSLEGEYLLNRYSQLEIIKQFSSSGKQSI